MKKSKLGLLTIPLLGLLLVGCNSRSNNSESQQGGTSSPAATIDTLFETLVSDLSSTNLTYKVHSVIYGEDSNDISDQKFEQDGQKFHLNVSTTHNGELHTDEIYLELHESSTTYYTKNNDVWVSQELPSIVKVDFISKTYGFNESLDQLKKTYTITPEGYYYAENLSLNINVSNLLDVIGRSPEYTYPQVTLTMHVPYVKVGFKNNHLDFFEIKNHAFVGSGNPETKTYTFVEDLNSNSVSKIYDIEKIGSTVVNLPQVG